MMSKLETQTRLRSSMQVDAPVNAGVWGGGLFNAQGQCVGILLQRSSTQTWRARYCNAAQPSSTPHETGNGNADGSWREYGQNIAYAVPLPVIKHFLRDVKLHGGQYQGFPGVGFNWQPATSAALRRYLGLPGNTTGEAHCRMQEYACVCVCAVLWAFS